MSGLANDGRGAGSDAVAPDLSRRVFALAQSWEELQSAGWNAMAAAAQYEELEVIAALGEQGADRPLATRAVEMAVYLCTFVEGRLYPSNAQRARLNELLARLREAAEGAPDRARAARRREADQRRVICLRDPALDLPDLGVQLARRRCAVRWVDDAAAAVAEAERSAPDVLLVESGAIAPLAEVVAAIERGLGDAKGRVLCVVFGAAIEHGRRLFAQRAGAHLVVESADPEVVATRIDEMLAQQRSLDYRVLIVEDDRGQAKFCESVLNLRGISTRCCTAGEDALDEIGLFRPDMVLLDLYLPGINGIEVAQRIRERPEYAFLPIVFLSGETDLDKRFDAIRMGGDDFITKPVKPRHLMAEVETRIRRARLVPARGDAAPGAIPLTSRAVFMDALQRASADADATALLMVGVAGGDALCERLGLVGSETLAQAFATAVCTEVDLVRPVCAGTGLLLFGLARGDGDAGLRTRLDLLRERLAARRWIVAGEPQEVRIAIAALRVTSDMTSGDDAIRRLRTLGRRVFAEGGIAWEPGRGVSSEDPVVRLARTLLRGQLIPEAIRIEFQALVPLTGEVSGQYATRFSLVAPHASVRLEVPPDRLHGLAREMGVVPAADRQCLRRALGVLSERVQRGDRIRLFLPVGAESVLDPAFAPWLATELQARALPSSAIVLEIAAPDLARAPARLAEALGFLQLVGTRLSVTGLEGSDADLRLLQLPAVSFGRLEAPRARDGAGAWSAERGRLVLEAGRSGKVVIANGARDAREIAELLKVGVQYVASETFAPWSTEPNFDFAGSRV